MANNLISENEAFFTSFEPKTKNRFIMYIDGIPSYMAKRVKIPNLQQDAKELPHINVSRYVKGKSKWGTAEFTLYDPIAPSGTQAVIEWVRLHHESVTGRDGYADFYKKDLVFNVLGPVGDIVSEFIFKGALITEANFGEYAWQDDEPVEISLTCQVDYVIVNF